MTVLQKKYTISTNRQDAYATKKNIPFQLTGKMPMLQKKYTISTNRQDACVTKK